MGWGGRGRSIVLLRGPRVSSTALGLGAPQGQVPILWSDDGRPEDIYQDLASTDRFRKGQALEAYAIYIMRLLGLRFLAWRKRARETGGAEVDAVLAGLFGSVPTRWQVQCKNTPDAALDVEDVAREVGIAVMNRATHILIIANAGITRDAWKFAAGINRGTLFTLFLLDRGDFEEIRKSPGTIGKILRSKAEEILTQRVQTEQLPGGSLL